MLYLLLFGLPVILVLGAICFTLDSKLTISQKIFYFLLLPIIEIIMAIFAVTQAKTMNVDLMDSWFLYLLYFLNTLAIIGTLIVSLVSELNSAVKLGVRFASLAVFSLILTWSFLNFK